jgi:hypothetical protein
MLIDKPPLSIFTRVDYSGGGNSEDFDLTLLNRLVGRMSAAAPLHDVLPDVVEFVTSVITYNSCMIHVLEGSRRSCHPQRGLDAEEVNEPDADRNERSAFRN